MIPIVNITENEVGIVFHIEDIIFFLKYEKQFTKAESYIQFLR